MTATRTRCRRPRLRTVLSALLFLLPAGFAPVLITRPAAAIPLVPPSASAQPPDTAAPANDAPLTAADRDFLVKVRQAGLWEGPSGRMAQTRSQNPLIKDAGIHLVSGHAELDAKVLAIGQELGVTLPSQPSAAQQGWLAEETAAKTPQDFDRVFANRLRAAHGVVYALVAKIRVGTRNSIIRAFAQRAMDVVLDHITVLERTGLIDFDALPPLPPPAGVSAPPPTVLTAYGPLTATGRDFLVRVRLAGLWEGPSGRMAQTHSQNPLVKEAGMHLIAGHTELDAKDLSLGRELGVDLPTEPNADQKSWLAEETTAPTPEAFDQVFVNRLRAAHGVVYSLLAVVRVGTRNSVVRAFAQRSMEVVLDHILMLERTGLVRYDALPLPPTPSPVAVAATGAARHPVPRSLVTYLVVVMFGAALVVTIVARRDLSHRSVG